VSAWLLARLDEPSTKAALYFAIGHTAALVAGPGPINWHALGAVLLLALQQAITADKGATA